MTQLSTFTPQTLTDWAGVLSLIASTVLYFFSRLGRQDIALLRQTNDDLRHRLGDQDRQIKLLSGQLGDINTKLSELEGKHSSLEDLVVRALTSYFEENPMAAVDQQKSLRRKSG